MIKVTLLGNLGASAEDKGDYIFFRVANNVKKKAASGDIFETTEWVNVYAPASKKPLLPFLTTGSKVLVIGSLSTRVFVATDGTHKAGLNIRADQVEIAAYKEARSAAPDPAQAQDPAQPAPIEMRAVNLPF